MTTSGAVSPATETTRQTCTIAWPSRASARVVSTTCGGQPLTAVTEAPYLCSECLLDPAARQRGVDANTKSAGNAQWLQLSATAPHHREVVSRGGHQAFVRPSDGCADAEASLAGPYPADARRPPSAPCSVGARPTSWTTVPTWQPADRHTHLPLNELVQRAADRRGWARYGHDMADPSPLYRKAPKGRNSTNQRASRPWPLATRSCWIVQLRWTSPTVGKDSDIMPSRMHASLDRKILSELSVMYVICLVSRV